MKTVEKHRRIVFPCKYISKHDIVKDIWYYSFTIKHASLANRIYNIVYFGETCKTSPLRNPSALLKILAVEFSIENSLHTKSLSFLIEQLQLS